MKIDEILSRGRARQSLPEPPIRRHLRVRAGLTQEDVRDAVEALSGESVTRVCVTRWESGRRTPRGVLLSAYLEVLDALSGVRDA